MPRRFQVTKAARHEVFSWLSLSDCVSNPAPLPESRASSQLRSRSKLLTRVLGALTARSSGFPGESSSIKRCLKQIEQCIFYLLLPWCAERLQEAWSRL